MATIWPPLALELLAFLISGFAAVDEGSAAGRIDQRIASLSGGLRKASRSGVEAQMVAVPTQRFAVLLTGA